MTSSQAPAPLPPVGADGTLNGRVLEVTHGPRKGERFTRWRDVPEGLPVRVVKVTQG